MVGSIGQKRGKADNGLRLHVDPQRLDGRKRARARRGCAPTGARTHWLQGRRRRALAAQAATAAIREAGAAVWMEVVSTTREDELRSVALARDLGVDWLMGGVHVEEALQALEGRPTRICLSQAGPSAIRRGWPAPPGTSRRNARLSPAGDARASIFSPIALPRPSRSISPLPAGADCATRARWLLRARSIWPSASPRFAPPAPTLSPSAPLRLKAPMLPARAPWRRSSGRFSQTAGLQGERCRLSL